MKRVSWPLSIIVGLIASLVLLVLLYILGIQNPVESLVRTLQVEKILLEYIKALAVWPVSSFASIVFLAVYFKEPISKWLSRLRIHYAGASISSDQQSLKMENEALVPSAERKPDVVMGTPEASKPTESKKPEEPKALKEQLEQWRLSAYLWEYSYLNFFLAANTIHVLNWLYRQEHPVDLGAANAVWAPLISSLVEREAILNAILNHHLAVKTGDKIQISPKGREYLEFTGKLTAKLD